MAYNLPLPNPQDKYPISYIWNSFYLCFSIYLTTQDIAIEAQDELNEDDKGPKNEIVKYIKDMRRKKATGDEQIPVDLLKELGACGLKNNDCTG